MNKNDLTTKTQELIAQVEEKFPLESRSNLKNQKKWAIYAMIKPNTIYMGAN